MSALAITRLRSARRTWCNGKITIITVMAFVGSAGHVKTRPLLWSFRSDDKNRRDEHWDHDSLSEEFESRDICAVQSSG